jgi:lysozyme
MNYSQSGLTLTEQFEGCKLNAYPDSKGVPTIAYGHTAGVFLGQTCTQAQAEAWLAEDIAWAVSRVNADVHVTLTQEQFDACVDFVFNCGVGNFESSTLLKLINKDDLTDAANEFAKWDKAGGQVIAGLLRRRMAEEVEFTGA